MEEDTLLKQHQDDEALEPPHTREAPAQTVVEPEKMGGDPACWMHLLDDEGNLS